MAKKEVVSKVAMWTSIAYTVGRINGVRKNVVGIKVGALGLGQRNGSNFLEIL
jgi:hypothetical protein